MWILGLGFFLGLVGGGVGEMLSSTTGARQAASAAAATGASIDDAMHASWRECKTGYYEPWEQRNRIRRWLEAEQPSDAAVHSLWCGSGTFGEHEAILFELVAERWAPDTVAERVRALHDACACHSTWWIRLLDAQLERKPDWLASALATTLSFHDPFEEGTDRRLLHVLFGLAQDGSADLRQLLESGARGQLGGSRERIAIAIDYAWRLQETGEQREALLQSILDSVRTDGEWLDVGMLVSLVLDEVSEHGGSPARAAQFLERVLADERFAEATAARLRMLEDWGGLPPGLGELGKRSTEEQAERVARASR